MFAEIPRLDTITGQGSGTDHMKLEHAEAADARAPRELPVAQIAEQQEWKEALELWLRWNECYMHFSAEAFAAGSDPRRLEDLMDQMDQLLQKAVGISRRLLADPRTGYLGS